MPRGRVIQAHLPVRNQVGVAVDRAASESVRTWKRDKRLRQLGYASYADYLRSPAWADVRKRYFKRQKGFVGCSLCPSSDRIMLHHRTYERVGAEELDDLVPLCPTCHEFVHGLEREGAIESLDPGEVDKLSDKARQAENRERAKVRQARQRAEFERHKVDGWREQQARAQSWRLRDALKRAAKHKVDVSREVALIEQSIRLIHERISQAL